MNHTIDHLLRWNTFLSFCFFCLFFLAKIQPPDEVTMLAPIEVLPPRLLVVINPFSGSKKGVKEYQQTVQPMFELAGITVEELLITGMYTYTYSTARYSNNKSV